MHTHPRFTQLSWHEETSRGLGCRGSSGNPILFNEWFEVYQFMNSGGAEFSPADRNTTMALGKPGYLRVSVGDATKKLMPDMTESQVYP